jgi:hypothetical protein
MSSASYEDYEREYDANLSRIRSFLAGSTRNRSTLTECERLLREAKACATAMQGLAEVAGDPHRVQESQQKLERDVAPLAKEVQRQLHDTGREELFYQAPDIESSPHDMDRLISSSDDLLRESQSILAETEYIGTNTIMQMGQQREQLQNANLNLEAVQRVTGQAKRLMVGMSRKLLKTKLGLYFTICVLSVANLWVLVKIYQKHHGTTGDGHDAQ